MIPKSKFQSSFDDLLSSLFTFEFVCRSEVCRFHLSACQCSLPDCLAGPLVEALAVGGSGDGSCLMGGRINAQGELAREMLSRFDAATFAGFQEYA